MPAVAVDLDQAGVLSGEAAKGGPYASTGENIPDPSIILSPDPDRPRAAGGGTH